MVKASIIIYITVAILVLLLLSDSPGKPSHSRRIRLKLRSSFNLDTNPNNPHHHHEPVLFDPLVADMRRLEYLEWEKKYFQLDQYDWEDIIDAEDYLNDEEKFNVTNRLLLLYPKIDVDPADGYVSKHELTEWLLNQAEKGLMHFTRREMVVHDRSHDGFISFSEYIFGVWDHKSGWWTEEHFNASDVDGNGLLNVTEFNDFLHPADSKNPKLLQWLSKETVREKDSDKDGKINFNEFFNGIFKSLKNYEAESHNSSSPSNDTMEAPARMLYAQLDKDNDGYLSEAEMLPLMERLHPSERYSARQQAEYIISQADTDEDGRLSLMEMIGNSSVFYSAILSSDYYDNDNVHDEL